MPGVVVENGMSVSENGTDVGAFLFTTKEICTEKLLFHKGRTEIEDNLQERTARELSGIASGSTFGHS